ncbi:MAG: DUF721 domain-containing protein [Micavibrio aeruginosavorus]|uniref:DUF721 domain-containing protein n=1 Tax=Micavibrio aeruginosavorus TaxID=349221 RepID=A0A2W5H7A5_9BACT|nr:MAG: DUF721 domain-containing protein [Micavibrio aeruginosavorus]
MFYLKPISDSVAKLTKETFSRKFVSLGRILTQWDDIVGSEMAEKCQPVKLHYRKPKAANEKPQATLDIAVSSADATLLHYQKDLILERINQLFGDKWVTGIKFVHIPFSPRRKDADFPKSRQLSNEEIAQLKASLPADADDELKIRLERLGQGILRRPRK